MLKRLTDKPQLTFRWEEDHAVWNALPSTQQEQCRKLWAQLLRAVAAANETRIERSASDEREDS
jgi:hypothetical protein